MIRDILILISLLTFLFSAVCSLIYYFALLFKVKVPAEIEHMPSMVLGSLLVLCLLCIRRDWLK